MPGFFLAVNMTFAQNAPGPVQQLDNCITVLARDIDKKLVANKARKITLGQFIYRGAIPSLSSYWSNQLMEELSNMSNKSYAVFAGAAADADRMIVGEIVEVADVIRVYTRIHRLDDRAIEAGYHSDFERNAALMGMLSSGGSRSSSVPWDEWENDSSENPVSYEIGVEENALLMNRTLHDGEDQDFFLLIPGSDGRLVMETTGNIDTIMEFYDEGGRELEKDDDGGSGSNARIRYRVEAGKRYIAKVQGYGGNTGSYGFRAFIQVAANSSGWNNPVPYEIGVDESAPVISRTLHQEDDEDFFLLQPGENGWLVMETTGDMDTLMYFYDAETREMLEEDDDSGSGGNARIRYRVEAGKRHIAKVQGYGGNTGSYGFHAYLQVR